MSKQTAFAKDIQRYAIGFTTALVLTLLAYGLVVENWFNMTVGVVAAVILGLAALQLIVQAIFFLHLSDEKEPRWRSVTFSFTILMLLVVLVGSLWVMKNLDYRMGMSAEQMQQIMLKENGKGF